MSALLEVKGVTTEFPGEEAPVPVVDGSEFSIARGEVLALVGESGCGKSMTALSLMRLVPKPGRIVTGSIALEGRELLSLGVREMRRVRGGEISMIFQEPMTSLNPVVRVGDQVVEAIRLHERVSKQQALDRCLELFVQVGIPDPEARLRAYPHQLSGGLKQRVMIAMALSTRPKLLIADEPTTALDVTIQAQIIALLRQLQQDSSMSILLITHDLGIVNELADRVAVMYAGRIVEKGSRTDILSSPQHPYTQGLLRSMPALAPAGERLPEIPGVVPSPAEWPEGCRFSTRCERRFEPCDGQVPGPRQVGEGQIAWCHALDDDGSSAEGGES
jgi:peptide/nickel transport system ATP-binding protein